MGDVNQLDIGWRSALLLALVSPLLLASLVLLMRDIEQRASRFLAILLLLYSVGLVPQIIGFLGAYQVWPGLTFAPFNNELWLGPLLVFHICSLTRNAPLGKLRWLVIPGVIQTLYYTFAFTLFDDYQAKWAYNDAFHEPYVVPVETLLTVAISLTCFYLSWRHIRAYRHFLEQTQSAVDEFDPSWLSVFLMAIAVAFTLWLGFEIINVWVGGISYYSQYPVHVVLTLLVNVLGFQAISRLRSRYPKMGTEVERAFDFSQQKQQDATSDDGRLHILATSLQTRMRSEQWFLQPRLSITDVARQLGSNESYVSRALNQQLGMSFNRFVNEARVEHAQQLMRDDPQANLLDVAFDAGFNSKASFNRLFKTISGVTPSQFRDAGPDLSVSR